MKRILIIPFLLIFSVLPCFAEYKEIPEKLQKAFKEDIEKFIAKEVPKLEQEIDKTALDPKRLQKKLINNGYDYNTYMNLLLTSEVEIWGFSEKLDTKLIKYTRNTLITNIIR